MSFGSQFAFHYVIYHKQPYNVDNRRHNIVLQLLDVKNVSKIQSKQELPEILTLFKMAESLQTQKDFVRISNIFVR